MKTPSPFKKHDKLPERPVEDDIDDDSEDLIYNDSNQPKPIQIGTDSLPGCSLRMTVGGQEVDIVIGQFRTDEMLCIFDHVLKRALKVHRDYNNGKPNRNSITG